MCPSSAIMHAFFIHQRISYQSQKKNEVGEERRTPAPVHLVQVHTVLKARSTERYVHNLHIFEYHLSRLYTWREPGKAREKSKKYTAQTHHSCTTSLRVLATFASTPSGGASKSGIGGRAVVHP